MRAIVAREEAACTEFVAAIQAVNEDSE